jgi:hypothetical protein
MRPALPARVFDGPIDPNPAAAAANVATRAAYALEAALFDAAEEMLAALAELTVAEGEPQAPGAVARFTRLDVDLTPDALEPLGFSPEEITLAGERKPATGRMLALWRRIGETAGSRAPQHRAPAPPAVTIRVHEPTIREGVVESPVPAPEAKPDKRKRRRAARPRAREGASRLVLLSGVWGPK